MSDKSANFVDYLDKYKSQRQCRYSDYLNMLNLINLNYDMNHIADKSYIGKQCKHMTKTEESFYTEYSASTWNATTPSVNDKTKEKINIDNLYTLWQQEHMVDISFNHLEPIREPEKTKFIKIDKKVGSIKDLLDIIEQNEYASDTEYNIDLKSLHNIKTELTEMNNMIGMEEMKKSVLDQLLYFVQELHVGKQISEFKHTVIYGSPGTGKTEIAKIIGNMYSKLGILKNNVFKKVTRNDLIAGYLGQTAIKTRKVIDECMGGVLFIDEAYSLASQENNDIYSKECLDTICEALSDHKDNLMVIIAGYEKELEETFFRVNAGLESRFIWRFKMEPYNAMEMMKIFKKKVLEQEWEFEKMDDIKEKWFAEKKELFKNFGRDIELLFTYSKIAHSRRIYGKEKELRKKLSIEDMNAGYETFLKNRKSQKDNNQFMHTLFI
jgi:SpoVK/Ycf46/Vps4 family AAA+-type ATPase